MHVISHLVKTVFSRPFYITVAVVIGVIFFISNLWLINYEYLSFVIFNDLLGVGAKLKLAFNIPDLLRIRFGNLDLFLSLTISILLGINMSSLWYFFKKQMAVSKELSSSLIGAIVSALGLGCASCGSVVISSVLGIGASSAFIGVLPFGGNEFGILGILILLYSIYAIAKKIDNNFACKTK
jgi:hypothetical protein